MRPLPSKRPANGVAASAPTGVQPAPPLSWSSPSSPTPSACVAPSPSVSKSRSAVSSKPPQAMPEVAVGHTPPPRGVGNAVAYVAALPEDAVPSPSRSQRIAFSCARLATSIRPSASAS